MPRLLIVSNRLPVTVKAEGVGPSVTPSAGGLATGMRGRTSGSGACGSAGPGDLSGCLATRARTWSGGSTTLRLAPSRSRPTRSPATTRATRTRCCGRSSTTRSRRLPQEVRDFDAYEAVNVRFADAVAARYEPGDLVWIHDYQLMLVPQLVRERVPDARIGFFLHIPFPSSEIFRMLPQRERMLEGLLGADLVGFHTATYVRHFVSSVLRLLGASTEVDRIALGLARGTPRRVPDGDRRGPVRGDRRGAGRCRARRARAPRPRRAAARRRRPARLLEGDPAPAARVRGDAARAPRAARARPARTGRRPLPGERRGLPRVPRGGGRARRAHPRGVRDAVVVAHPLPVPRAVAATRSSPCTAPPTRCSSRRCATG